MKIKLPVTWEMCGIVEVEAEDAVDAVHIAKETDLLDHTPLPEGTYVDGSFALTSDEVDFVEFYQNRRENCHA